MRATHKGVGWGLSLLVFAWLAGCRPGPEDSELRQLWETCQHGLEACSALAAETLPIDEASFRDPDVHGTVVLNQPNNYRSEGRKLLMQAIHGLATLPIQPLLRRPTAPRNASFFEPNWREIFESKPGEDPRWALFQWTLSKFGLIRFEVVRPDEDAIAYYSLLSHDRNGALTLNQLWIDEARSSSPEARAANAISSLVHEASHGSGQVHEFCRNGDFACDGGHHGPHGLAVYYLLAFNRAASKPLVSPLAQACLTVEQFILHPHPFSNTRIRSQLSARPNTPADR